jgi:hypothetical protein
MKFFLEPPCVMSRSSKYRPIFICSPKKRCKTLERSFVTNGLNERKRRIFWKQKAKIISHTFEKAGTLQSLS